MFSKRTPLLSHRRRDSWKRPASIFPAILARRGMMHSIGRRDRQSFELPPYNLSRSKKRQILQPKAGFFVLSVAELPRLNDLIGLPKFGAHNTDRVLNGDSRCIESPQCLEKGYRLCLQCRSAFPAPPAIARDGQVRTRHKRYDQIEAALPQFQYVALNMTDTIPFGREQVAGNYFMPGCREGSADNTGKLASN